MAKLRKYTMHRMTVNGGYDLRNVLEVLVVEHGLGSFEHCFGAAWLAMDTTHLWRLFFDIAIFI